MNQYVQPPSIVSKRVPGQYHLSLHTDPTYKGLPSLVYRGGLVKEYLDRLYNTIQSSLRKQSKIFAVRVDLHFPRFYSSVGEEVLSNEYLHTFVKALRKRLQQYEKNKKSLGQRVHDVGFDYVWAREHGPESDKPHFHLLLLFNGHAFNTLGHFSSDCESLYNRIGESWAEVLKLHPHEGVQFVYFPVDAQYRLQLDNRDELAKLFQRSSYLAKVATKNFNNGFHPFGGSRS